MTTRHAKQYRQYVRQQAGVPRYRRGVEIRVVEAIDTRPPLLIHYCGGWYTRGGTPIQHPTSYARKGWSSMVYVAADDRTHVQVTTGWLAERRIPQAAMQVKP